MRTRVHSQPFGFLGREDEERDTDVIDLEPMRRALGPHIWAMLDAGLPFFDRHGNQLFDADDILEALRRFGVVYSRQPGSPPQEVLKRVPRRDSALPDPYEKTARFFKVEKK